MELYYRRSENVSKGRVIPARVETVVIYLPDVRSCVPTRLEWDDLNISYKQKLDYVIKQSETVGENSGSAGANEGDAASATTAAAATSSLAAGIGKNSDQNLSTLKSSDKSASGNNSQAGTETAATAATTTGTAGNNEAEADTSNEKAQHCFSLYF